ncbi:hypothetical protein ACNKHS_16470 [Shigella flexneri]
MHHVCSVERIKGLQRQARRRLKTARFDIMIDTPRRWMAGLWAMRPSDAIIVTGAAPPNPAALLAAG